MSTTTDQIILFEHPVVERVRSYLRLESLFVRFEQMLAAENPEQHHLALSVLFEIMDCAARAELKLIMLQELERQKQRVINHPTLSVQHSEWADELQNNIDDLHKIQQKFGQHLRENEWLMGVRQRMAVAGGTSPVDLPSYHFWRGLPACDRQDYLQNWAQALMPTGNAIRLLMNILRHQPIATDCIAHKGSYQQPELGAHVHLVQIEVDHHRIALPEVSANKYMMHVRFVDVDFEHTRGKQVDFDVPFRLLLCSFDDREDKA